MTDREDIRTVLEALVESNTYTFGQYDVGYQVINAHDVKEHHIEDIEELIQQ